MSVISRHFISSSSSNPFSHVLRDFPVSLHNWPKILECFTPLVSRLPSLKSWPLPFDPTSNVKPTNSNLDQFVGNRFFSKIRLQRRMCLPSNTRVLSSYLCIVAYTSRVLSSFQKAASRTNVRTPEGRNSYAVRELFRCRRTQIRAQVCGFRPNIGGRRRKMLRFSEHGKKNRYKTVFFRYGARCVQSYYCWCRRAVRGWQR